MSVTKPLGAGLQVNLTRTFTVPAPLVFDCFTEVERFAKWWGPAGCTNEMHSFDPRPGGEISLTMSGPGFSHTMGGQFVEIDRPRRLVFLTMAFEAPGGGWGIVNRNTITFKERNGVTTMTLHTLVEKAEGDIVLGALGGMEEGWSQSLDRLVALASG